MFPSALPVETELVMNITENGTTVDEGHFSKVTVSVDVPVPVCDRFSYGASVVMLSDFLPGAGSTVSVPADSTFIYISDAGNGLKRVGIMKTTTSATSLTVAVGGFYYILAN